MHPQQPPFPSFSLVLSQGHTQQPSKYITFPWASVTYQDQAPVGQTPANTSPVPLAPIQPVQTPNTLTVILRAIRQFFAMIVTKLKARIAS
ncbi:hypothetical protein B0H17DRAFT_1199712 [Mycena rosella]|uniref:Uncharacterized protein n=1 Tax=Mycena rosella TaxID=1033263 RepID=A0AAD7GLL5_MYCRO|nr:hypothetical protein B0H17DRAFT_1199712 [Mycena rosella]